MPGMDKLAAMAAFVDIVEQGSLTGAARARGRSLPTMVRTLATLEGSLGVRLLQRTTRRMSLTEEGRDYLERCRRILAEVADAEEALVRGQVEPRGSLRITAPVLFGQMHVGPSLAGFLRRYPQVKAELLLLDRVVDLVEEGIDVGIRIAHLDDASMIARPVGEVRRVVCASPAFLRRQGVPVEPADLADAPCVVFRGLAPSAKWQFRSGRKRVSVPVAGPIAINQASAALDACVAGLGFGQFLSYQVADLVKARKLRIVLPDHEPQAIPVSIVYAHSGLVSPRIREFVQWLREALLAEPSLRPGGSARSRA